jgi:hypothetical protein
VFVLDLASDERAHLLHLAPGVRQSLTTADYTIEGYGGLVNDGVRLYFSDRDKLRSILPDGTGAIVHGDFLCPEPGPVAVDETAMYMAQDCGRIIIRGLKTSTGGAVTNLGAQVRGTSIASGANEIYVAQSASFTMPTIHVVPKSGGATSQIGAGHRDPSAVVVAGATVLWVDRGSGSRTGSLERFESGAQTTLASGLAEPTALAIAAGGRVCWTNAGTPPAYTDGSIQCTSASAPGQAPVTLASGLAHPWGIAIDGSNVFWIERGGALLSDGGLVFGAGKLGRVALL